MRNATLSWVSMALAVAFSFPAADVAFADNSSDGSPPDASPAHAAPTTGAGGGGGSTQGKIVRNAPDDSTTPDFPSSSRLVRDIVAARPNEDLIICIAGCRPNQDRVIYAQPTDRQALPKSVPVSELEQTDTAKPEAAAAAAPSAAAPTSTDDKKSADAVMSPAPGPANSDDKKAATPADAASAGHKPEEMLAPSKTGEAEPAAGVKSEMVPTSTGNAMKDAGAVMKAVRFGSGVPPHAPAAAAGPAAPPADAK